MNILNYRPGSLFQYPVAASRPSAANLVFLGKECGALPRRRYDGQVLKQALELGIAALLLLAALAASAQTAEVRVAFSERLGPLHIDHMALGQGGLSEEPMWADRIPEVRTLHPRLIRLFIQEYFDLLPERGRYHFETLDRSVNMILATGAKPLMCLCFKPRVLFPEVNQDMVEPQDYNAWEELIFNLVRHYQERGAGIRYWEVANEPDIGEDGGCPYRFQPESYVRYYRRTAAAILRADPEARVGGPALANVRSPLFPALLASATTNATPLHFVSWHSYSSDPKAVRGTIDYAQELLQRHPSLKPETFLDEWNMDLMNPPLDPRFQPCYVAEVIWQMKDAGLDYSCYYHIRDWYVDFDKFAGFMSPHGTAFMARWWNRMPQFDGLFDYQNRVRPAYFAFKLLSRLAGERLPVTSNHGAIHGFATYDPTLRMHNLLLWNFSKAGVPVRLLLAGLPKDMRTRHIVLDASALSDDENARLRPAPFATLKQGDAQLELPVDPYAVHYWSFE